METIYYAVDIQNLLSIQEKETLRNDVKKINERKLFLRRKSELLKIVLPFIHGVTVLHNNKCTKTTTTTTGADGLLGLRKKDLNKEISIYIDKDFMFAFDGTSVDVQIGVRKVKFWLHEKIGTHVHTPNLGYSMTTFDDKEAYGKGVEHELNFIARYCSRFKDDWKL